MKLFIAAINTCIAAGISAPLWACDFSLSEFDAELQSVEADLLKMEQRIGQLDRDVDQQSNASNAVSYGTTCHKNLRDDIDETKGATAKLAEELALFDKRDNPYFACVIDLRRRGEAALTKAKNAADTVRVLRIQTALKNLTDYDIKATEISVRITYSMSKAQRLHLQSEVNHAICNPDAGGLNGIDF